MNKISKTEGAINLYTDTIIEKLVMIVKIGNPQAAESDTFKKQLDAYRKTYANSLHALVRLARSELMLEIERDMNQLKEKKLM